MLVSNTCFVFTLGPMIIWGKWGHVDSYFPKLVLRKVFKSEHYLDLHLERRHMDEAKIAAKRGSTCTWVKKTSHMVYVLMMLMGVSGFLGLGREQQVKSPLQHPLLKKTADSSLFSVEGFLVMLHLLLCQMAGFFKGFCRTQAQNQSWATKPFLSLDLFIRWFFTDSLPW